MREKPGTIAFIAAVAAAALLVAAAALIVGLFFIPGNARSLNSLPSHPWWFVSRAAPKGGADTLPWIGGTIIAAGCIGLAMVHRIHSLSRSDFSRSLPFLSMFLLSLSVECMRIVCAFVVATDRSVSISLIITKIVYWGRFVGLLSLLIAALYVMDMKYSHTGFLAGGVCLVAFAMSFYLPIDSTVFLAELNWKLGDEQGVWFVNLIIGGLVVASGAGAARMRRDRRFLSLTAGFALLLAARECLFFSAGPVVLCCGLAALTAGSLLCLRAVARIYREAPEKASA